MKPMKDRSLETHACYIGFTSDPIFKDLTLTAKVVYNELLYRYQLSIENEKYQDDDGTPFTIYPQSKIAEAWGLSVRTVERAISELKDIGLILVVSQAVGKPKKIYLNKFSEVSEELSTRQNGGPDTRQNGGSSTRQNGGQYKSKQIINEKNEIESISIDKLSNALGPRWCPSSNLFSVPPKTKTAKRADKWYKERRTQINGHDFPWEVQEPLERFLRCLGERQRSADQISASAWDLQLDRLHDLDGHVDLQRQVIYKAASAGYRSFVQGIDNAIRHNRLNPVLEKVKISTEEEIIDNEEEAWV